MKLGSGANAMIVVSKELLMDNAYLPLILTAYLTNTLTKLLDV